MLMLEAYDRADKQLFNAFLTLSIFQFFVLEQKCGEILSVTRFSYLVIVAKLWLDSHCSEVGFTNNQLQFVSLCVSFVMQFKPTH